jgi:sterol 3beta-glucosyltransferase
MVLTAGSTGDVEPFAALAARLARRGHDATLAADGAFEALLPEGRVRYAPIRADFRALVPGPGRRRPSARDAFAVIRHMLEDSWEVARATRPEAIVAHQKTLGAAHVAQRLGAPHLQALTVPMLTPTRAFPVPGLVGRDLGGTLNRASYRLVDLLTLPYAGLIRRWRKERLGLAPRTRPPPAAATLYCYSPLLVPTPPDWPPDVQATGFWRRERRDAAVDGAVERFVAAGPPPVYVGFGSSVGPDPARLGATVGEALARAGVRAVVATGWGALGNVRDGADTLVVEAAPHDWLFPRVAAVVHHGGAGTTAAGLHAGRPTVICPFGGDQPFWGAAVHRAGVGPAPLPAKALTPDRLAEAIRWAVASDAGRSRAAGLADALRREDGTGRACERIESAVG